MKIIFFNTAKVWGGGEKWHHGAAILLAYHNFDVLVVTNPNSDLQKRLHSQKIPVKNFKVGNLSFLNFFKILKIAKFFKKSEVDAVVMNLSSDVKTAGIAAKIAGVKHIIYRRGSAIPIRNTLLNRFLFGKILTQIIANSEATKQTIVANNKKMFPLEKIAVIYNGIDLQKIDNQKFEKIYTRQNNEFIIGNAGRLEKQKGQRNLILIAEILKQKNINFKILIAGSGRLETELKEFAKEKNVDDKIIFLGFVENIKSFMQSIDLFVLTSYWEGFGYVIAEAMAAQKPTIAFNLSSNPELVQNEKTGFLVPEKDIETFCKKIEMLNSNKKLLEKMGKNARQLVEQKFDTKISYQNILKYFSEL